MVLNRLIALVSVAACCAAFDGQAAADTFGSGANTFDIEFVTIGNPGNLPDTTGNPNPAGTILDPYRIGKFEISEQMIDKANAEGGLGITKDTPWPKDMVFVSQASLGQARCCSSHWLAPLLCGGDGLRADADLARGASAAQRRDHLAVGVSPRNRVNSISQAAQRRHRAWERYYVAAARLGIHIN